VPSALFMLRSAHRASRADGTCPQQRNSRTASGGAAVVQEGVVWLAGLVELAGIEPASFGVEPGLLRVQSVLSCSQPRRSH